MITETSLKKFFLAFFLAFTSDAATIVWVSHHAADNQPSFNAAAAGFTQAPDIAYTQLLEASGHNVIRYQTTGTPDAAFLNAADLVISSRSVPSVDFEADLETAEWNAISAPVMILGAYVLRANRLGFTTGTSIPDVAGAINLTVLAPDHPIFFGINLDSSNTMLNSYAGLVSFNANLQRGISVNTSPLAGGGTVLATVGTAGDPAFGGMIIGEWAAGATMGTIPADILGGHRLVFLTGSREALGSSSEIAGIFDLSPDGTQMFLNAVSFMAIALPPNTPVSLISDLPDKLGLAGQAATFRVLASGSQPLSYQWRRNGSNIVGANNSSYTTPPLTAADTGTTYSVVVSNNGGANRVTSREAVLTILNSPQGSLYEFVTAQGISWQDARLAAEQRTFNGQPGRLATINGFAENLYVEVLRQSLFGPSIREFWLGGFQLPDQSSASQGWMWITSEPFVYFPWQVDEPNDCCDGVENNQENHLAIGRFGNFGGWNDEGGLGNISGYLVEYPDTIPPLPDTVQLPPLVGQCTAAITAFPTATDARLGPVTGTTSDPLSYSTPGTFTITWNYTDTAGNNASQTQTVIVQDTIAPVIQSVASSPSVLWAPNHKMVPVQISATAIDNCDPNPITRILSVSSNEPKNGLGDGASQTDWQVTGHLTLNLRAERSGQGSNRIYTITVESLDASGNRATGIAMVTVPRNQSP